MYMAVQEDAGLTRIVLVGKLDMKGAEQIDLKFTAVAGVRPRVAVDMEGVDYIASMGIRTLVMCGKAAAQRGNKLVIFGCSESVAKVITTSGLDQSIPVASDWQAARALLS